MVTFIRDWSNMMKTNAETYVENSASKWWLCSRLTKCTLPRNLILGVGRSRRSFLYADLFDRLFFVAVHFRKYWSTNFIFQKNLHSKFLDFQTFMARLILLRSDIQSFETKSFLPVVNGVNMHQKISYILCSITKILSNHSLKQSWTILWSCV